MQARSLHHNAGCRCFRLWCGRPACTENVEPEFCTLMMGLVSEDRKASGCSRQQDMTINPLLGGAEAEGFGVGVGDEEPTPALRATPPKRGFSGSHQALLQNSGRNSRERLCLSSAGFVACGPGRLSSRLGWPMPKRQGLYTSGRRSLRWPDDEVLRVSTAERSTWLTT